MKFKKPSFHPVPAAIGLLIAALFSWELSHWTDLPFWGAFSLVVVAMFINGVIARKEDDAPGGFNNPLPPQSLKKEPIQPLQGTPAKAPSSSTEPEGRRS